MANNGAQPRAGFPDLSQFPNRRLGRRLLKDISDDENGGTIYADLFRKLQLKPTSYQQLFPYVSNVRRSNIADLRQGTAESFKRMSIKLLESQGHQFWRTNRAHLLPRAALPGEQPLVFKERGPHQTLEAWCASNAEFFPILGELWMAVRNVSFVGRPPYVRRENRTKEARSNAEVSDEEEDADAEGPTDAAGDVDAGKPAEGEPVVDFTGEGEDTEMVDAEAEEVMERDYTPPQPTSSYEDATTQTMPVAIPVRANLPVAPTHPYQAAPQALIPLPPRGPMTFQQTNDEINQVMVHLRNLGLAASVQTVKTLFVEKLLRTQAINPATAVAIRGALASLTLSEMERQPFPAAPAPLPPSTVPAHMMVAVVSPRIQSNQIPLVVPQAPITQASQGAFFHAINAHLAAQGVGEVKGYIFSYTWNLLVRYVAMDGLEAGWEVFQADLAEAARCGVTDWGMKVGIA